MRQALESGETVAMTCAVARRVAAAMVMAMALLSLTGAVGAAVAEDRRPQPQAAPAPGAGEAAPPPEAEADAADPGPPPRAVLRALDKVTARVTTIEVGLGETTRFGSLTITPRACDKAPPWERPESAVFLEIDESKPGQDAKAVFRGWMFASSPGLSAMEHPAYDVWLLDCASSADKAADQDSRSGAE